MLKFTQSQRFRHDLGTKQQQQSEAPSSGKQMPVHSHLPFTVSPPFLWAFLQSTETTLSASPSFTKPSLCHRKKLGLWVLAKSLQSYPTLQLHRWQPTRLPCPWDSPGKNTGVGCHFLLQCMRVKSESEVTQSCPTLHNPMDCSLLGSSIHGIFQARVLEWGAIAFSMWVLTCSEATLVSDQHSLYSRVHIILYYNKASAYSGI